MTADLVTLARREAAALGFDAIGFAPVVAADEAREHGRFMEWLARGSAADMAYLSESAPRRASVTTIVPGARSVIVVVRSYAHPRPPLDPGAADISRYAAGRDYHELMSRDLTRMKASLSAAAPRERFHYHVDTGPVLERSWAAAAGLAWIGKNTCAISTELGSYFFIGEIVTTAALATQATLVPDHCGSCTRCIDACPTGALDGAHHLDARRCIAYWNVEYRGRLPEAAARALGNHAFGCDVCQEVCPWNREDRVPAPRDGRLAPVPSRAARDAVALLVDAVRDSREIIGGSALRRTRRQGLLRNLAAVVANLGRRDALATLAALVDDADPVVAEAARAAGERLRAMPPPDTSG